jgi:monomeric sarcosine oxidase
MPHYDVIVLGLGGVGSAALYHVAQRGRRVLGLDRFSGGHDRGSSHGETRIIRQAYFEHADYVPLLLRAYQLWNDLERQVGETLFHQVGLLQVGPPEGQVVRGVLAAARQHQLAVDSLSGREVERRFPGIRVPSGHVGVFEPKAGYLKVERCVLSHLAAAKEAGAEAVHDAEIKSWEATASGIRVLTSAGEFTADRLIIAAGAWTGDFLGQAHLPPLRVLRKQVYWYTGNAPEYYETRGFPTFLFELPQGVFYGFPERDAGGLKVAEHSGGVEVVDPLHDPRLPDAADEGRVREFLATCLPGVGKERARYSTCFYTMSPDENFLVDRHPASERVVFAAGLSGHGFKFTSVLGEALADLALEGGTHLPIEFLSLRRFASSTSPTRSA